MKLKSFVNYNHLQILDCTIRDGGYINNWDFNYETVFHTYIKSSLAGTDVFEVGYVKDTKTLESETINTWDCCSEFQIASLKKAFSGAKIAVMLDEKQSTNVCLRKKSESSIDMIRIATHWEGLDSAIAQCLEIKEKGYLISLQLMGIAAYSENQMTQCLDKLKIAAPQLDYVYIGDSYGSLFPDEIRLLVKILKTTDVRNVGYHAHNNLQMAFANALTAMDCGINILDGSLFGMGRGAGNLPLEILVGYLEKGKLRSHCKVSHLLDCIENYYYDLKEKYDWGYNLAYLLSGMFNIHPNYATQFIKYSEYPVEKFVKLSAVLDKKGISNFNIKLMNAIIDSGFDDPEMATIDNKIARYNSSPGYWKRHAGKKVLVIANGLSIKEKAAEINGFINREKPIVIGTNFLNNLYVPQYHLFSNAMRLEQYYSSVSPESMLIISEHIDREILTAFHIKSYEKVCYLDSMSNKFDILNGIITTNCRTVGLLAIGVGLAMGAAEIYIAGLDGYSESSQSYFYNEKIQTAEHELLQKKVSENERKLIEINSYMKKNNLPSLKIITPTSYSQFYSPEYLKG